MTKSTMRTTLLILVASWGAGGCIGDRSDDGDSAAVPDRHCFVHLEAGATPETAATVGEMSCYDTVSEVIRVATAGGAVLPADTDPGALDEATLRKAGYAPELSVVGQIVIGTDYAGPNFTGDSLTITAPTGCLDRGTNTSFTWLLNTMPIGWDNVVSSVLSSSDCGQTEVFDLPNERGASFMTSTCRGPTLGALTKATSSQKWIRGQTCF